MYVYIYIYIHTHTHISHGSDGKESEYNVGDSGLTPGSGRFPGEGNGYHSSILAWRVPWIQESGELQFKGSERIGHD